MKNYHRRYTYVFNYNVYDEALFHHTTINLHKNARRHASTHIQLVSVMQAQFQSNFRFLSQIASLFNFFNVFFNLKLTNITVAFEIYFYKVFHYKIFIPNNVSPNQTF